MSLDGTTIFLCIVDGRSVPTSNGLTTSPVVPTEPPRICRIGLELWGLEGVAGWLDRP